MPLHIDEILVWIATHKDGSQGIPAIRFVDLALPLVGADKERIESLRAEALSCLARPDVLAVELVRFSGREVLETHKPREPAS